jgi:cytochrome c5
LVYAFILSIWAFPAQAEQVDRDALERRLAPVGKVCIQGQDCFAKPGKVSREQKPAGKDPAQVIDRSCKSCHASGLLGAPKIGDKAHWETLARQQGGVDGLLRNAIKGINAMPPRGACSDCTDDDLRRAIQIMSGLE